MNSLTKRLVAGVAAAATLLSGMALAGSAMAVDSAIETGKLGTDQPFTISAGSVDDLKGKNLVAVKLADYSAAQTDGTNITGYDVATVEGLKTAIYNAANASNVSSSKNNGSKTDLTSDNPMQWVVQNLLDSSDGNHSGQLRNFLTNLAQNESIKNATDKAIDTLNPTVSGDTASVSAQLPAGIYVILDKAEANGNVVVSMPMMNGTTIDGKNFSNNQLGAVQYKVTKPTVDKKIVENAGTGNETKVEANTAAIGDTVTYELTTTVPNYTGYNNGYCLALNDTLSKGLTFGKIVSVKIDGNDTEYAKDDANLLDGGYVWHADTPVAVPDSTGEYAGGSSFSIKFGQTEANGVTFNIADPKFKDVFLIGKKITVRYTATLNGNAVVNGDGNPNKVNLTYSRNPNGSEQGDSDDIVVKTYTGKLALHKVDVKNNNLQGAKFEIRSSESGDALKFVGSNGTYTLASDQSATQNTVTELETPASGILAINGLKGTYYFKETKSPLGATALPSFTAMVTVYSKNDSGANQTAGAQDVALVKADANQLVKADTTKNTDIVVTNVRNFTEMPKTGATWLCIYAAMALLCGGGAFLLLRSSKKNS
ncbi:isopeptide-forming domain-containing fimbrial protein [Bifidobacterium moukalabense]|uniref:isopeptide-forming domain-containing fimbrial protein n=1 Tax=Bifidobacterium moukalabense TaxID=1333651 RepID=UPI0010F8F81F|nr:isopeptide-forming domain-containing fimbrial protein [Bifidobacterium moukalabense]